MTERNEYVDDLRVLFDNYVVGAKEVFDAYDDSLEPDPGPEPEPELKPRPVLPASFTAQVEGETVVLGWDMPLPVETESVQIMRRPDFREGDTGWKSITKQAQDGFVDTNLPKLPASEPDACWEYKIRGYGYRLDETPHASAWSEVIKVEDVDRGGPIDPPVPPPSSDFVALECAGNSAAENKMVALPALRETREARASVGTIGDVGRGTWIQGDLLKENLESVVPKGYAQWSSNLHNTYPEPRPGKYTWKNIGISPAIIPELASQLKWGTREYNCFLREFISCDFTDIPREHGFYVSNYASTLVDSCTFLRCGSQAVQWAHREESYQQYGPDCLPYSEKPEHIIRNSHFVDNAFGGDRRSFNVTFFHPGCSEFPGTLKIEDCSFVADWSVPKYYNNKELRSTGALVVTPTTENAPLVDKCMMEKVHIKNCLFDYTKGDRAICSIRSAEEVLIEDSCFIARESGYNRISIDKDYGFMGNTKTKRIIIRNCIAEDMYVKIYLAANANGDQVVKSVPMHCPGGEIVIDGATGEVIV